MVDGQEQKLNGLTDVVIDMSNLHTQHAKNNQQAFESIQSKFQDIRLMISSNSQAIQETRQLVDRNARAIYALSEERD